jgi:hypothetical protein
VALNTTYTSFWYWGYYGSLDNTRVAEIIHGSLDGVLSTFFWSLDDHNCADDAI